MNFFTGLLLTALLWARSETPTLPVSMNEVVRSSMSQGDANLLSDHFNESIELIIDSEQVNFTKVEATHAEMILRSFFRKNPPRHFRYVHRGTSDNVQYSSGSYEANGQSYAVYVLMHKSANQPYVIDAVHFRHA
ncbi:DUF4783 domain-containing protein [Spirosoma sp. KUDC1026]|uniref:DUF4783 domain-containing protein n=1 Tax=Spirosoma sp. KUDC1026 TaxID=2745947 RepID=UPI00159BF056|nr:DUF4783 domain-containing protein [Spirosoma sp. KUDC1026]QKZ12698.1 DUF4783 domain-containing protein [Spirosoma sp. KUDC1026]